MLGPVQLIRSGRPRLVRAGGHAGDLKGRRHLQSIAINGQTRSLRKAAMCVCLRFLRAAGLGLLRRQAVMVELYDLPGEQVSMQSAELSLLNGDPRVDAFVRQRVNRCEAVKQCFARLR